MNNKELKTILNCISNAQEAIAMLACDNYPFTEFHDKDLKEMFYQLNDMCLLLNKKMEDAEAKAETV